MSQNQNDAAITVTGILAGFVLAVGCASAAEAPATDCAAIESADERLACYDAAAAGVKPEAPAAEDFGTQKSKQDIEGESLVSGIVAVGEDAYGKLIIELENGQVWRQVENKRFSVKVGEVADIRHGSFGMYKLYIQGRNVWTRVRREQ